jgi:RNA polymerase sigma factor (sigma-70 family)
VTSLERLLADHHDGIARVASLYAKGPHDREDLRQEIALSLLRALPSFRGECSERTFVFRVAHNQGVTFSVRAKKRTHDRESDAEPLDERPSAEVEIARARRRTALFDAIRSLPVAMRQVLSLALEELSHREIADVLGTTEGNVAVRLSRAKAALKAQLSNTEVAE